MTGNPGRWQLGGLLFAALLVSVYLAGRGSPRPDIPLRLGEGSPAPTLLPEVPLTAPREQAVHASEPAPAGAGETGALVKVRTIAASGKIVAGAQLFLRDDEGARPVGVFTTSKSGEATVALPRSGWLQIVARKAGFAAASRVVGSPAPRELVLRLEPGATIAGRVVLADGSSAGEDVLVLALPAARTLSAYGTPGGLLGEPEVVETRTDTRGRFTLDDLNAELSYDLIAGGHGWVQEEAEKGARPGSDEVTLRVLRGYGALVQLREPDGSRPRMEGVFGTGVGATAGVVEDEARFASHAGLFALLSGIDVGPLGPADLLYVAGASTALEHVTIELQIQPPGYESSTTSLLLAPLSGGLNTVPVTLIPTASGWGSLVVERVGGAPGVADTRIGPFGTLTLVPPEGLPWHFAIEDASQVRHRVEVPFGRYRVMLAILSSKMLVPTPGEGARFVDIGPEETVVRYDAADLGAIEVRAFDQDSTPYEGELVLFLGAGRFDPARSAMEQGFRGAQVLFRRAPYLIQHLPAQPYSLRVDSRGALETWYGVDVEAGRTHAVDIAVVRGGG